MKVVGTVALCSFPLWKNTIKDLAKYCSVICVRYDGLAGDPEILKALEPYCRELGVKCITKIVDHPWSPPLWRQEMLEMADDFQPDIVLCPDEDEVFEDTLADELKQFWVSEKKAMMFSYLPLITEDGTEVNKGVPYPPLPHMKAFKWAEGLSYYPWHTNAVVAQYVSKKTQWQATTKIAHYCCYNEGLRKIKKWRSDIPGKKQEKAVTILGFAPSAKNNPQIAGEVWSMNNCYEVFPEKIMQYMTRIYDLHVFGKRDSGSWLDVARYWGLKVCNDRNKMRARDNRTHIAHLDELGKLGHRIIMQEEHPLIANSERYPLEEIEEKLGLPKFWGGTGVYLIGQAILEGYTEIRVFGLEQNDWEHILQRESFAFWLGYAAGRGIRIGGELALLARTPRRYGYEYGPEWDDAQNNLLWTGWPYEVKWKVQNTSLAGKLHNERKS